MALGLRRFFAIAASIAVGAALAIPAAVLIGYDLVVFQPRLAEAQRAVMTAPLGDRSPPRVVAAMIVTAHHGYLDWSVTRAILLKHSYRGRSAQWVLDSYLTDLLVRIHVSPEEQVSLYATLRGLTARAHALFSKDPVDLSVEDAVTVVLTMVSPRIFGFPDLLAQRKAELAAVAAGSR